MISLKGTVTAVLTRSKAVICPPSVMNSICIVQQPGAQRTVHVKNLLLGFRYSQLWKHERDCFRDLRLTGADRCKRFHYLFKKRRWYLLSSRPPLPPHGPLIRVQQWTVWVMGEMPERRGAAKHDAYWAGRMATVAHMVASLTQTGQLGTGQAWSLYRPIVCLQCSR